MKRNRRRKAEMTIQSLLLAMLFAFGLFIGVIGFTVDSLEVNYDTTGYNESSIGNYDKLSTLGSSLNEAEGEINTVVVDSNLFDYFAGVWNKLTAPFKTIYQSYTTAIQLSSQATGDLGLPKIFADFLSAAFLVLVIVGIVMIKFYLARSK